MTTKVLTKTVYLPDTSISHGINLASVIRRALAKGVETLYNWQYRFEYRRRLRTLDDHLLNDMGITRHEAWQEARKPFWVQ